MAATNTQTRDLISLKRSRKCLCSSKYHRKTFRSNGVEIKEELNRKLEEFATQQDNLEEIFENREQIEISRFYERLPKPTAIAIKEFEDGKVSYRLPEVES